VNRHGGEKSGRRWSAGGEGDDPRGEFVGMPEVLILEVQLSRLFHAGRPSASSRPD
jgi:hypothetical protein